MFVEECAVQTNGLPGRTPINRRRHVRQNVKQSARIAIGPETMVFCQTVNLSEGGACVRFPRPFRIQIGELLLLEGAGILSGGRQARVVAISNAGCHCAFIDRA
jgi:hypothetical protein